MGAITILVVAFSESTTMSTYMFTVFALFLFYVAYCFWKLVCEYRRTLRFDALVSRACQLDFGPDAHVLLEQAFVVGQPNLAFRQRMLQGDRDANERTTMGEVTYDGHTYEIRGRHVHDNVSEHVVELALDLLKHETTMHLLKTHKADATVDTYFTFQERTVKFLKQKRFASNLELTVRGQGVRSELQLKETDELPHLCHRGTRMTWSRGVLRPCAHDARMRDTTYVIGVTLKEVGDPVHGKFHDDGTPVTMEENRVLLNCIFVKCDQGTGTPGMTTQEPSVALVEYLQECVRPNSTTEAQMAAFEAIGVSCKEWSSRVYVTEEHWVTCVLHTIA